MGKLEVGYGDVFLDQKQSPFGKGDLEADITSATTLDATWDKPLKPAYYAHVRDALSWVDAVVGFEVPFSTHIAEQRNTNFINLVMLLRWKNADRQKQTVWQKESMINEHNKDLERIQCYFKAKFSKH